MNPAPFSLRVAAAVLVLFLCPGCGSDDPADPVAPPAPEITEMIPGTVTLPAGWTGDAAGLVVVNSHGTATCDQGGACTVECFADGRQLVAVTGRLGRPLLLAWFGGTSPVIDVRTTAEVLLWFGLGTWMLPPDGRTGVRDLIAALDDELDPLVEALAQTIVEHPDGLPVDNPAVETALVDLVAALLGRAAGDKGIIVAPDVMQSGVEILNEGGINRITVKNSYRRRSIAFVHQKAWLDADGLEHPVNPPVALAEFEIPPVDGFSGSLHTILGYFLGGLPYEPVLLDPLPLSAYPGARTTIYDVDVLGFGMELPADPSQYTSAELAAGDWMALKCLVVDYFFPLLTTIVGEITAAGYFDDAFGGEDMAASLQAYLTFIATGIPEFHAALSVNDWWGATLVLITEVWTSDEFQESTLELVGQALASAGMAADRIEGVTGAAESFFKAVGLADVIGSLVDSIITGVHFGECERANTWDVTVSAPVIHIEPREAELDLYHTQLLTCVLDDDTGGPPSGAAYAFRWHCAGATGTLVNPADPSDTDNDFLTSYDYVHFVADAGTAGAETVWCDLYVKAGPDTTFIQRTTAALAVIKREVVLPESLSFCPGGVQHFTASLDRPYTGDEVVVWSWRADGTAGTLTGPDGQVGSWDFAVEPTADYAGDPTGGTDRILCIASLEIEGGYSPIDTAVVALDVGEQETYPGELYGEATYNPDDHTGGWAVYVRFPKVAGAVSYHVVGHSFYDPAYYGDGFSISGPPWPAYSQDRATEIWMFLTGGGGNCDGPPYDSLAWGLGRFAGGIFEVTPNCQ